MKYAHTLMLSFSFFLLCSCAMFGSKQPAEAPMVPPNQLGKTVGKNWQVIVEAPDLTDERAHVPFQMEESVQSEEVKPVLTADKVKIASPR